MCVPDAFELARARGHARYARAPLTDWILSECFLSV